MSPISSPKDFWFIFQNSQLLVLESSDNQQPSTASDIGDLRLQLIHEHHLGQFEGVNIYCGELNPGASLPAHLHATPLRKALETLHTQWYTYTAKAFAIINWDNNHRYCGRCGAATLSHDQLFERVCPICQLTFYPRISPSVIVLIRKQDQVLLARGPHFLPGVYGLIAGYVEPGETVENAIHREVLEEVGIRIQNIVYYGSQAWPFPDSLMLAFIADYDSGELTIDHSEIEDAGWYHYDNIPGRPSSSISIARKLINHFVQEQKHKASNS